MLTPRDIVYVVIPPKDQRVPVTLQTSIQPLSCYIPYLYLCYLARRPNTYFIRVLLLPVVVMSVLTAAYRYTWTHPSLYVWNWGQCFFALMIVGRSLDMALTPQGMLKYGEFQPGVKYSTSTKTNVNGGDHINKGSCTPRTGFFTGLADAFDLAHTLRGLSYKFGAGTYVPPHSRPFSSRRAFLMATFRSFVTNYLALDLMESIIKLMPNGVGTVHGGSIFLPDYFATAPWLRYAISTFIHLLTGSALMAGFFMVYDLIVLIAVGLLHSSPSAWPPVMENPFAADSMHSFWARRWHQLLRRTLIVLGAPGYWVAGDVGMLFSTFIASGLFHECSMFAMDRGLDLRGFAFFALQGPVLVLERVWRKVTGRRVCGWPGRTWVYVVIFIAGQPLTDSWHRRGLGGGMIIPPFLSPTRLILVPFLQQYLSKY